MGVSVGPSSQTQSVISTMVVIHVNTVCLIQGVEHDNDTFKSPFIRCEDTVLHIIKELHSIFLDMDS